MEADWNYVDGELEGKADKYYESGKVKAEWNFVNGKLEGYVDGNSADFATVPR